MSVDWLISGALLVIGLGGLGAWLLSLKKLRHADLLQVQNEVLLQEKDNKIAELSSRCHTLEEDNFKVEDSVSTNKEAISWLHLSPESKILSYSNKLVVTTMGTIKITGASKVEITDGEISVEYNRFLAVKIIKIYFSNKLSYMIV